MKCSNYSFLKVETRQTLPSFIFWRGVYAQINVNCHLFPPVKKILFFFAKLCKIRKLFIFDDFPVLRHSI